MNDSIEQLMKEWQPRRPSAELRSRIFAAEARANSRTREERTMFDWSGLTRWLVPAMGCFVMAVATLRHPQMPAPHGVAGSLTGQEMAFSIASGHSPGNNVPATTVERAFGRPAVSNNDAFVRPETNTLSK